MYCASPLHLLDLVEDEELCRVSMNFFTHLDIRQTYSEYIEW
jgi:hypothetical protein